MQISSISLLGRFKIATQQLLFSHVDAWCVTLVIGGIALLLHDQFTWKNSYLLFGLTAGYWFAFTLNDYFDAPDDALNQQKAKRNFFVKREWGWIEKIGWTTFFAGLIGPPFWQFGWTGLGMTVLCGVVMWGYSAPPLRFKSRPGLDLIIHTLFVETFPYWVVLILIGVQWQSFDYAILLIAGITSFTAQLEQQARDYETDRLTERTFTTAVGLPVNQLLLKAGTIMLMIVTIISFGLQIIPLQYLPIALCAMPVGLRRFSQKAWNPQAQKLSYQMAVLAAVYLIGLLVFTQLF